MGSQPLRILPTLLCDTPSRSLKRSLWYGLQDLGSEIGGRRHGGGSGLPQSSADVQLRPDEFWAVKDVSFPDDPHTTSGVPNGQIPISA